MDIDKLLAAKRQRIAAEEQERAVQQQAKEEECAYMFSRVADLIDQLVARGTTFAMEPPYTRPLIKSRWPVSETRQLEPRASRTEYEFYYAWMDHCVIGVRDEDLVLHATLTHQNGRATKVDQKEFKNVDAAIDFLLELVAKHELVAD